MRLRDSILGCAALLAALAAAPTAHAGKFFGDLKPATPATTPARPKLEFTKFTLGNGLEVILHEDHRTALVAVNVWYHVGSKDEAPKKNGFAHLFEHVMFQGSKNVGEDKFFKYLERSGATDRNGTTNADRTNYFETVPSHNLETVLWLESDRMGSLLDHADDKTFANQREVVKNERRQNYENAPYGLVHEYISKALYPESHPYHRLTIGSPADLDAAQMDDVRAFFRQYYVPNNATLVIAGHIEPAKTRALVEKYFGSIPKGAEPPVKTAPVPSPLSTETRLEIEAGVQLPRLTVAWTTPPGYAPGDAELDIVSSVLSTGKSSRLYKRLVYDLQIAQDVNAYQESRQLSGTFEIEVTLKKGKKLEDALKIVDEELAKLRKAPPAAGEVARAKTRTVSSLLYGLERVTARANAFNEYNQRTGDPGYLEKDLARYEAVTPADVQQTVSTWLPEDKRVVAFVRPTPDAPRAGRLVAAAPKPAAKKAANAARVARNVQNLVASVAKPKPDAKKPAPAKKDGAK